MKDEVEFEEEDWCHVTQETRELCAGLLSKDPQKRQTTDNLLNLTFKLSSKNSSYKSARIKFKKTVIHRKFKRHSMSTVERTPSKFRSRDDLNGNFNKSILDKNNRNTKAFRYKRGSKTTEELMELQLPMKLRDSFVDNLQTDDDRRKKKKREQEKKEKENERLKNENSNDYAYDDQKNE